MTQLRPAIPILRSFDEAKAREFYCDFMGFAVVFEHRFDDDAPLYMGLRRDGLQLHISEHHGDASPGARIYVPVGDLDALARELQGRSYRNQRPGDPEDTPWGTREITLTDPFGNRLTFAQQE